MAGVIVTLPIDEITDLSRAYRSLELMASSNTDNDPSPVLAILNDRFDLLIETINIHNQIRRERGLNHSGNG